MNTGLFSHTNFLSILKHTEGCDPEELQEAQSMALKVLWSLTVFFVLFTEKEG